MRNIRTILYATDFSESSGPAADLAGYLAKLAGAHLQVLHVVGEMADQRRSQVQPEAFALLEREVELQAIKDMEAFCEERFGEVSFASEVRIGIPFEQILKLAGEIEADLIVLGTHGRTGIERVLVGSTAERVMRRSQKPVLTVPITN